MKLNEEVRNVIVQGKYSRQGRKREKRIENGSIGKEYTVNKEE
jgi:hypothetical protein